ncbi:EF-hand domain-containing protein 1-like [Limanda limanda]|uniref:EF-hand domain-containing protein 1-like n=1 Tax=Limanda limanda TaxID=27771 RepID=UPI0029C66386|nr:EF-hand domain-containing protein 1-like [Limanda limanda]
MSWYWNSHGLPFLPGNSFRDVTKCAFHRSQTLHYKNGFALPHRPGDEIGKDAHLSEQLLQQKINTLTLMTPDVRLEALYKMAPEEFVPAHVTLDKKVLRFYGYFQQDVLFSPDEVYRVRPVMIYYYLEDDSMLLFEPRVKNTGLLQGRLLKRQRVPHKERGDHYHYKDLNVDIDLDVYGVTFHITHCDEFTKEFMKSEGIILNDPRPMPVDPYTNGRKVPESCHITPSQFDQTHQFLTMDGKVLRFYALWDDAHRLYRETRTVIIHYYLADDTVEIREVHEQNSGRDPFPVVMCRQRLPKTLKPKPFPSCVLEVSEDEVDEYFSPTDFQVGQTMKLLSRSFLLYDFDGFTKEYFQTNHPEMEMKPIKVPKKVDIYHNRKRDVPPYNGFGSLEDSLQNCLYLIPKPPKKDVIKMLDNNLKELRYSATLNSKYPVDNSRRFILTYYLANDMISIFEKPGRNSGMIAGKFLEKMRIPKPGSTLENLDFYSPADFAIGAKVDVFGHRFVLTDADQYVLTYLESISNPLEIPSETLDSLRQKLGEGAAK